MKEFGRYEMRDIGPGIDSVIEALQRAKAEGAKWVKVTATWRRFGDHHRCTGVPSCCGHDSDPTCADWFYIIATTGEDDYATR